MDVGYTNGRETMRERLGRMAVRGGAKWGWYSRWRGEGGYNGASERRAILEWHVRSVGAFEAQPERCQKSGCGGPRQLGQTCACSSTHDVNKLLLSFEKRYAEGEGQNVP